MKKYTEYLRTGVNYKTLVGPTSETTLLAYFNYFYYLGK